MMSEHDFARIRQMFETLLNEKLQLLAKDFADAQEPICQQVIDQRHDMKHVVAAIRDLQETQRLLIEKLDAIHGEPNEANEEWWQKGEGEEPF